MQNNYNYGYGQPSSQRSQLQQYAFVNGPEGAKAYQMQPNTVMMLMDADNPLCYKKETDAFGKASLRYFKLEEVDEAAIRSMFQPQAQVSDYASKEDIDAINKRLDDIFKRLDKKNKDNNA